MNYEGILEFKGTWRKYQARVLEHADRYMSMENTYCRGTWFRETRHRIELDPQDERKSTDWQPSITIREQWEELRKLFLRAYRGRFSLTEW